MSSFAQRNARAWRERYFEPRFEGNLSDWATELKLPQSVRHDHFEPDDAPWLNDPADAILEPGVRQVTFVGAAGSAKSLLGEIYIAYTVKEGDGLIYYVHQTDEAAIDAMEDRLTPMLEENGEKGIEMPKARSDKRTKKVKFKGVTLYAVAAKKSAAQSKRVKHLVCEETHMWEKGMLSAFKERLNSVSGPKCLVLSTGSVADDETDSDFKTGTAYEWHVCCPKCRQPQKMRNKNLKYEISENTIDFDGNYKWGEIRKSVYYLCANDECKARWKDTPRLRKQLTASGHYVQTNPNASGENKSFHISALAVHWFDWSDLAVRWILANLARKMGKLELLQEYIMKVLAEAWDENRSFDEGDKAPEKRTGDYEQGEHWKDGKPFWEDHWPELTRFQSIDKQEGWFSVEIRAYAADGTNRLIAEHGGVKPGQPGAITTFEQVEELREKYHVDPLRTFLDIADDTKLCQQRCVQYGWQGLWGSPSRNWPHDLASYFHPRNLARKNRLPYKQIPEKPIRLPFSTPQTGHATSGLSGKVLTCIYYYWSNPVVKDHWHFCHNGGSPGWTQSKTVSKAYQAQTNSEIKRDVNGKKEWWHGKRDNHFCDCSQMNHVAAMMDDRIDMGDSVLAGHTADSEA